VSGNDEFGLIERIRRQAATNAAVTLGIGDDAALLKTTPGTDILVAKDVLMEGVHFDPSVTSAAQIGYKALAVNLSDIAAMAGRPTAAFVGLVLPAGRGARFADELMAGLLELAAEFDVALAGGDTNIWNGPAVISVTVLGEPTGRGAVLRSGARPGDWLMVTGALGGSLSGRHLAFAPRIHEAQALHAAVEVHAMIDLSDGLASDLQHIAKTSGVALTLEAEAVPVHDDVPANLPPADRLRHALSDGEDFELLFCVDAASGRQLLAAPPFEIPLTRLGEVIAGEGCWLQTSPGDRRRLEPSGWEHRFASH
jgi:thiamine-monophosphate kinase